MGCESTRSMEPQPAETRGDGSCDTELPRLLSSSPQAVQPSPVRKDEDQEPGGSDGEPVALRQGMEGDRAEDVPGRQDVAYGSRDGSWLWPWCWPSLSCSPNWSWESEILQVGAELEQRLRNPEFVATCCDLDGSGRLDVHALQQAARACGLRLAPERLTELMQSRHLISKQRFAEIVASTPASASRRVPHALRGMALGQLLQIEELFIKSGWLAARCAASEEPNFYALDSHVISPMCKPGSCAARSQDRHEVVPPARRPSSFSELLNDSGLMVHCFLSHAWGQPCSATLRALRIWAEARHQGVEVGGPQAVVYWIGLFALNRQEAAEEADKSPLHEPFNAALARAKAGALMVLDEQIQPFGRIWCLFELWRIKELQRPFELICDLGTPSLDDFGGGQGLYQAVSRLRRASDEALSVSAREALSSAPEDKFCIWREIAAPGQSWTDCPDSKSACRDADPFGDFHHKVRGLLSTSILDRLLAGGQYAAARKGCLRGACPREDQIERLCMQLTRAARIQWLTDLLLLTLKQDKDGSTTRMLLDHGADGAAVSAAGVPVLVFAAQVAEDAVVRVLLDDGADAKVTSRSGVTALMRAAHRGNASMTRLLIERGVDTATASKSSMTALMAAAHGGHDSVAKLLLEGRASVSDAGDDGSTALLFAAEGGHLSVAKLLLDAGADTAAATNDGSTALMAAARGGNESMVTMLLAHGALKHANDDGETALLRAARGGHDRVAKLLLTSRADVADADNGDVTALMRAAQGGRTYLVKELLEHGADANAACKSGVTPLMQAAQFGHDSTVKMLLEHGADGAAESKNGATALSVAVQNGHGPVVKSLVEHGVDAAAANKNGVTPLMRAAEEGHESMAKLLLEHGADAAASSKDGCTALTYAARNGRKSVVMLLIDHGGLRPA
ncbi:ANKHD1 [Symbiodinium sp. CCMP2592]|nr:ANKHD1 [Symbiodinium sp. CCMP2592]